MILGLRVRALNVDEAVATDNTGLTGEDLRTAAEEDRARGLHPFVLGGYWYLFACIPRRLSKPSHSRHRWNDIVRRH